MSKTTWLSKQDSLMKIALVGLIGCYWFFNWFSLSCKGGSWVKLCTVLSLLQVFVFLFIATFILILSLDRRDGEEYPAGRSSAHPRTFCSHYNFWLGLTLLGLGIGDAIGFDHYCPPHFQSIWCWVRTATMGLYILLGGYLVAGDIAHVGHRHQQKPKKP